MPRAARPLSLPPGDGMVVQADGSVAALEGTALELLAKRGVQ